MAVVGVERLQVETATASGQVNNSNKRVETIEWHARSTNENPVLVGLSDVSGSKGRELTANSSVTWKFEPATMVASAFYVWVSGNDKVDWTMIYSAGGGVG